MDEKSEMQNGEQFAPTSTPEEIPAEYRKTVRKEDGSPFTGEDLRAMGETVIPCIEEVNGEIRKIYLTSNKLLSDNPPPELDKTREIVRYAGSHLLTVMDDLGRMEALTFLSQEGAEELERRRRRQIKTNRDAINLLNSAPEPWIKNMTLTVFFEQQGSNPDFADLFLMDFVQAAFDIENGWAVREGPFKKYVAPVPPNERREKARELGLDISHLKLYPAIPAEREFFNAYCRNNLFYISEEYRKSFGEKDGQLSPIVASELQADKIIYIIESNPGFFGYIVAKILEDTDNEGNETRIYLPKFFSDTGIDPRPYSEKRDKTPISVLRYRKFLMLLDEFKDVAGRLPSGLIYKFMSLVSYDEKSEVITISSPYLFALSRSLTYFSRLAHPEIANEPNKAAVEIAVRLLQGLATRGTSHADTEASSANDPIKRTTKRKSKDGSTITTTEEFQAKKKKPRYYTFSISYKQLINECPQLKKALDDIENPPAQAGQDTDAQCEPIDPSKAKQRKNAAYNSKLKQTFTAAYRILLEQTDVCSYYKNFRIMNRYPGKKEGEEGDIIIPSKTTLSQLVKLRHNGRNPDYKEPKKNAPTDS